MSCYRSRWSDAMVFFTLVAVVFAGVGACQALTSSSPAEGPEPSPAPTTGTHARATTGPATVVVTQSAPVLSARAATTSVSEDNVVVFEAAEPGVRRVAASFARKWLGYGARREGRRGVLGRVRPLVTDAAFRRLARSQRLRLPWRVLRDRGERARFVVVGVSVPHSPRHDTRGGARTAVVAVEGLLRVLSSLGATRTPASLRLRMARTDSGWLVAGVRGGGA